jgi:hypothetical protein
MIAHLVSALDDAITRATAESDQARQPGLSG